ncbi:MAG: lysine--tRNA ligase [Candidatus Lindowbacteria bacterium]|nr:lysine--tRNA ligase [Candidatus Lindowbacteria bacterium]
MSNEELENRRRKRDVLIEAGIDPYPARFSREMTCVACRDRGEEILVEGAEHPENPEIVQTAGRVRAIRGFGKASFTTIEDESGRVQLHLKKDVLGDDFIKVKQLDIGDFVGVSGGLFRTRRGEVTIEVQSLTILSKSLEPLPAKWHGLSDVEIRSRRRYLDMIANPEVRTSFKKRSQIITEVRRYLTDQDFLEVETPMMQPLAGGAAARPFITHHNALDIQLYLRIAPELYLKRLIVGGFEKVFELNKNFRNEGMDRSHNPEFTMMELYEAYADFERMMEITEELITTVAQKVNGTLIAPPSKDLVVSRSETESDSESSEEPADSAPPKEETGPQISLERPWKRIAYFDAIVEGGGPKIEPGDEAACVKAVKDAGINTESESYADCLEALFEHFAEKVIIQPTFVIDYPTVISPLAKKKADQPELVERFELFIGGTEYANAFSELNDPDDQEERFRAQAKAAGSEVIDEDYIKALRTGMPPAGGLGIGIDRLVMLLTGNRTIRDVILFPTMRPE